MHVVVVTNIKIKDITYVKEHFKYEPTINPKEQFLEDREHFKLEDAINKIIKQIVYVRSHHFCQYLFSIEITEVNE